MPSGPPSIADTYRKLMRELGYALWFHFARPFHVGADAVPNVGKWVTNFSVNWRYRWPPARQGVALNAELVPPGASLCAAIAQGAHGVRGAAASLALNLPAWHDALAMAPLWRVAGSRRESAGSADNGWA